MPARVYVNDQKNQRLAEVADSLFRTFGSEADKARRRGTCLVSDSWFL